MDSSTVVVTLRVLVSLAVVLGLVWWFARRGKTGTRARVRPASVSVVGRQTLGRRTAVAVVEVEGRRLLLGLTDQQVSLLAELTVTPEPGRGVERTEIDPAELARMVGMDAADLPVLPPADEPADDLADDLVPVAPRAAARAAVPAPRPAPAEPRSSARAARPERAPRRPAARTPAVPMQRRPLEGSILDASAWRQAVVAVQERTIRR